MHYLLNTHRMQVIGLKVAQVRPSALPWADPRKIPFTVTGPYLKELFLQSFVTGLHQPQQRPSANDWETALVKTVDLMQPCLNSDCGQNGMYLTTTQTCMPILWHGISWQIACIKPIFGTQGETLGLIITV